jgi:hypothetical protein
MGETPIPPLQAFARLAFKYDTLAALRRDRERGAPVPPRDVFRALAAEFPGCLAELDTLPLDVIDARAAALRQAGEGAEPEPWMGWLAAYHALFRAALWIKPRSGSRDAERLAEEASAATGVPVDAAFARSVARPPGGRISAVVLAVLAAREGRDARDLARAIFPGRRR